MKNIAKAVLAITFSLALIMPVAANSLGEAQEKTKTEKSAKKECKETKKCCAEKAEKAACGDKKKECSKEKK